jgi:hypothetical protein
MLGVARSSGLVVNNTASLRTETVELRATVKEKADMGGAADRAGLAPAIDVAAAAGSSVSGQGCPTGFSSRVSGNLQGRSRARWTISNAIL